MYATGFKDVQEEKDNIGKKQNGSIDLRFKQEFLFTNSFQTVNYLHL